MSAFNLTLFMKTKLFVAVPLIAFAFFLRLPSTYAQTTAFTYQGKLNSGATAADGNYDFLFFLYSSNLGGSQIGPAVTNQSILVSNGLFNVALDFGDNFPGEDRWLEINVRTNGNGTFTTLTPRQKITSAPYALTAGNLSGLLPASQISGALPSAQLSGTYSGNLTFNNASNFFSGNGAAMTALNASQLTSGTVPDARLSGNIARTNQAWSMSGNSGTIPGNFLGTTDNQPLEFMVNNSRVLRIEPNGDGNDFGTDLDGAVNLIGGSSVNVMGAGVVGSTIAGGGSTNWWGAAYTNVVLSDYGFLGGGLGNRIDGSSSATVIAGGYINEIGANNTYSVLGGGRHNVVFKDSPFSTIAGGDGNKIATNTSHGTIGGGSINLLESTAIHSTIGGGNGNTIGADTGTIGGGGGNTIGFDSRSATIAGGRVNEIGISSRRSTIGGGERNEIGSNSWHAVIPGGHLNAVGSGASYAFAAGRRAKANHTGTFVWGDSQDADFASTATNQFLIRASGGVGIGTPSPYEKLHVRDDASGGLTFPVKVANEAAATAGSAVGILFQTDDGPDRGKGALIYTRETTWNRGSFQFLQNSEVSPTLAGTNNVVMTILNNGNVGIGNTIPSNKLMVVNARCDGSSWINACDRNLKENFAAVDAKAMLNKVAALPIQSWSYKAQPEQKHVGPAAQDFRAAFGLGQDETSIATVDADGVALTAIQGLNQKVDEQTNHLKKENAELKQRVAQLEQFVSRLTTTKD